MNEWRWCSRGENGGRVASLQLKDASIPRGAVVQGENGQISGTAWLWGSVESRQETEWCVGASAHEPDTRPRAWSQGTNSCPVPWAHLKADDFLTAFVPPRVRIQDVPLSSRAEKRLGDKLPLSDWKINMWRKVNATRHSWYRGQRPSEVWWLTSRQSRQPSRAKGRGLPPLQPPRRGPSPGAI